MLKYVGDGSWLPGVPARDLTDDEVKQCGGKAFLLRTRLYEEAARKMERPLRENQMAHPGAEDK